MAEPKRIAQVVGKMNHGGVEAVVMNYYRHIDRTKIQFDFIADADSGYIPREEIEALGGRVYVVPPYQKLKAYIPALIQLFKQNGYQIVHSHINTLSVFPLFAAKRAGVPVRIAHNHSTAAKGELKNVLKYTLRPFAKVYATHCAACSELAGAWLFGKKTLARGEIKILSNAIEWASFHPDRALRETVRQELGLGNQFVIGHVGRFCYQKNQAFLLNVLKAVRQHKPDTALVFVGDGEDRAALEASVNEMDDGLRDHILFLGNRDDVPRLYQAMDVFVLPSRYEGLPVVGVEAQAAGLPCILSDKMTAETKLTSDAVFMRLEDGPDAWAQRILSVAARPWSERIKVTRCDRFSIEAQADQLLRYYDELSAGAPPNVGNRPRQRNIRLPRQNESAAGAQKG